MSGRFYYCFFKPIIVFISIMLRFFTPVFFRGMLYELLSLVPTKLGVLCRCIVIKSMATNTGDNIYIGRNVVIKNANKLSLGSNVSLHENCYIDAVGGIFIGSNVSVAHGSSIISFEHTWENKNKPIKYNVLRCSAVKIYDDVWIGCGVRILSGTVLNERSIVAAGSVVKRTFPGNVIIAGVPGKVIKGI